MTNAIEQTKREMYDWLNQLKSTVDMQLVPNYSIERFEPALEAHLEDLRQDQMDTLGRLAAMTEERDELRNKHQALQMASQTAAEVIRGLRSELLEARECNATASASEAPQSEFKEIYQLGVDGLGKPCPFPPGTIERLHWMDGARSRIDSLNQRSLAQLQAAALHSGYRGSNGQAGNFWGGL